MVFFKLEPKVLLEGNNGFNHAIVFADFTGDGHLDFFTLNPRKNLEVIPGDGKGKFPPVEKVWATAVGMRQELYEQGKYQEALDAFRTYFFAKVLLLWDDEKGLVSRDFEGRFGRDVTIQNYEGNVARDTAPVPWQSVSAHHRKRRQ